MKTLNLLSSSFVLVPITVIILNNLCPKKFVEKYYQLLAGLVAVFQIAAAVSAFFLMNTLKLTSYNFSVLYNLNISKSEYFSIHSVSLVFLFCIGLVSLISVLVASRTIEERKSSYVNLLMTLIIGMNGMVLVTDLFTLYVFLDVIGISSFVLIAMSHSRKALEGSIKYLVISELATVFILTGFSFLFMIAGSLSYKDIGSQLLTGATPQQTVMIYAALALILAGFAVKAGAVPFHSWLPDAHQSANTSVSILLSGIVIKIAGVYGFFVLSRLFSGVKALQIALAALGILSVLTGALLALCQTHFKRIIAYSSVSQIGYILLGLSTGTTLGLIGAVAHVFSHAVFKSTLFTNAAAVHEQTGTLEIAEMGGLQSRMPVTGFSSVIASLSTAGIPPFAGFWSKLLIILALWGSGSPVLAGFALCASILTAAYLLRMQKAVFFGKTPDHLASVTEITGTIKFTEILLTGITSVVGVLFPLILLYLQSSGLI